MSLVDPVGPVSRDEKLIDARERFLQRREPAPPIEEVTPTSTVTVQPVFVDDSGRRAWIFRLIAAATVFALAAGGVGFFAAVGRTDTVGTIGFAAVYDATAPDPFAIAITPAAPGAPCEVITGFAYVDADLNGSPQPSEQALPGLTVTAYGADDAVVARATTASDGRFELRPTVAGPTRVEVTNPNAPMMDAPVGLGTEPSVSFPSNPNCDVTVGLTWVGMFANAVQPVVSTVGDRVWLDSNGNGRQDPREPGLPAVGVRLYDTGGALLAQTVTALDGTYRFGGIQRGRSYRIALDRPEDRNAGGPLAGRTVSAHPGSAGGVTAAPDPGGATTVTVDARGASTQGIDFAVKPS